MQRKSARKYHQEITLSSNQLCTRTRHWLCLCLHTRQCSDKACLLCACPLPLKLARQAPIYMQALGLSITRCER